MSIIAAVDDIISKPLPQAFNGGVKMARAATTSDFQIPDTREALWDKVKRTMAEANGSASKNMGIVVICLCALIPGCLALVGGGIAWGGQSKEVQSLQDTRKDQNDQIKALVDSQRRNEMEIHDLKQQEAADKALIMSLNGELEAFKHYRRPAK